MFPRSLSDDAARHGTFDDVIRHLPRIRDMGFDVLYFPPIHPDRPHQPQGPQQRAARRRPTIPAAPTRSAQPRAGTTRSIPNSARSRISGACARRRRAHGLELALDFAIQCSPDHPWLREHKDWFDWRPDGSLRYAENPPKKYEDIVNVDFYAAGAVPDLWLALCDVVLFWAEQGVRMFRVDNPHTKPLPFWEWMIAEVRARYPDAIFLAEAFTRPKVMYRLAKLGFSQSYTYFTWRNTKRELTEYLDRAERPTAPRDFFRPNFFVNTPDINPVFLQTSGRPGFLIRAALAATLSGLWGVYNGFELCEARAAAGREEYVDSEKYQLRAWDWERPGNIVRRDHPAQPHPAHQPGAADPSRRHVPQRRQRPDSVLRKGDAGSLQRGAGRGQPRSARGAGGGFRAAAVEMGPAGRRASLEAEDLLHRRRFVWTGKMQHVRLTPDDAVRDLARAARRVERMT